ncbi:DNA gyrase subunit A [Candidatus Gracilibacteria bacterium]|nr:DNA gyrase subunit A [Candidatus Gracilibacteria bacterium]
MNDVRRDIKFEMENCYLDYAMSVIVSRALPDIRDGLKPVHRRILYAMHDEGLHPGKKYSKSAGVVGEVLKKYHPHGDSSVYEAMVRLAQPWALRYPLVDGQGNFGSVDGDSAAAYRYTEARMSKITAEMLADIDKETVDWRPNFDASHAEPTVLPARVPNLLLMGSVGIAVGMATNIPPHNLREVVAALQFVLKHKDRESITVEHLMDFIKGPDFPTGGVIYNRADILSAYATGRGSIILRGKAVIEETAAGRPVIIINELPYQTTPSSIVEQVAHLITEKIVNGIAEVRDESNKDGIRVVLELKRDSFPREVLNQLFKLTGLQSSFAYNMIALTDRGLQPKLFNLKEILEEFLVHRQEVIKRRTTYELRIAEERAHILEGLKIALDNIDEVIETIKKSKDRQDASDKLQTKFKLSERQAVAILEMQLQRLSGMERKKLEDELAEKLLLIADLKDILSKPERVDTIISDELTEINDKYGDDRRTEVHNAPLGQFSAKDTIPNEEVIITLSKQGYVKRLKAGTYRTQKRGGMGVATATKEEDEIQILLSSNNHDDLWFFTSTGRVFQLPTYEIPEFSRTAKGSPIVNFISLQPTESISTILNANEATKPFLFFATTDGTVKRLERTEITNIRSSGLIVMKVEEGNSLGWVCPTSGSDMMLLVSNEGQAIQFPETDVRAMGRSAMGVRGIRLKGKDILVTASVVSKEMKYVFTASSRGLGKLSDIEDYRSQGRGGSGVKVSSVTPKTGKIISATMLTEDDRKTADFLLVTKSGQTVRMPLKDVRLTGRVAQGVILTRLKDDDAVTSMSIVREREEEEEGK